MPYQYVKLNPTSARCSVIGMNFPVYKKLMCVLILLSPMALQICLAVTMGGKDYETMTGDVAAVNAAVEAGAIFIRKKGLLVNKVVIPQPRPEILDDKI